MLDYTPGRRRGGCDHGEEHCDDGLPSQCRGVIRPVRTRDPIDELLARAVAAIDALGRGMAGRVAPPRFALLGAACAADRPDVPMAAIVEQLCVGASLVPSGSVAFRRLYLAICGLAGDDTTGQRIAAWRQAVLQQCPCPALYEFRLPMHADAQALWHAVDTCGDGDALVAVFAPAAGALVMLVVAGPRDDAPWDATIERLDAADAEEHRDAVPHDRMSFALADGIHGGRDSAAVPIEWTSRDRRWHVTLRRNASGVPVAASDPTAAALALLQRISGYPVRDALARGDTHMTLAVDSIMAMEYAVRFRAAFGRSLPVEALLDRPPLHALVERIGVCLREATNDDVFVPLGRLRAVEGWL